jgi:hypothetical protein
MSEAIGLFLMTHFARSFLRSAKGEDARRQTGKEHGCPLGGAPDTATVLRGVFLEAQRAGMRAAKQWKSSLDLWAARLIPRPFCAEFS